jgi:non-canonical purine NTP pyrophosphatase (RdgB/HAM1 family)
MSELPPFTFVTGNAGKRVEVERILGAAVDCADVDLPEVQSLDIREVVLAKGREAWRLLGRPLVVEETGLELAALNGFPGPLVKWLLKAVGADGIARTALALGEPRVTARCVVAYTTDGVDFVTAEGATHGAVVLPGRGGHGFGWDPVFLPEGEGRTYGELSAADKDSIGHRGRAWRALRDAWARPKPR